MIVKSKPLNENGRCPVTLPLNSSILDVIKGFGRPKVVYLSNEHEAVTETVTFFVAESGDEVPSSSQYLGTVVFNGHSMYVFLMLEDTGR